jgi:uncharacterized protein (DUF58 family)
VPTWRLGAAAGIGSILGALLPVAAPWGVLLAGAILLAAAGADWALTVPPARVAVGRALPTSLGLGESGRVTWTVSNPSERVLHVAVADELPPTLHAGTRRFRLTVPPRGRLSASTPVRPSRRGDMVPAEVVVRVEGPWRLMARQAARTDPARLRVLPAFPSRRQAQLRALRSGLPEVGLRTARARGGGIEFDQLRDYSVDDESHRMDWAASARAGKPIVRTFRAERNQQVLLLLDNGRTMAGRVEGVPRVEHAMDAAMMLTAVATRLGDRTGLIAFDQRVRTVVAPGSSRAQFGRVVDAIYRLEPELAESDYRRAFSETLARYGRRALLVVLTELAEPAVEERLLGDLPLVARTHLVVVAAVRDPDVEMWARAVPANAGDSYRKAAAVSALENRRRMAARLTSMGVIVIDALPGRLAPRLADTYLRVKATGRL